MAVTVAFVLAGCAMSSSAVATQKDPEWQSAVSEVSTALVLTPITVGAVSATKLEPKYGETPYLSKSQVAERARLERVRKSAILKGIKNNTIESTKENNAIALAEMVRNLKKHIGTPYVFSGSTPSGWDCSGLVMWFYEGLGVELEHRASKQLLAGEVTDTPTKGDIVVFKYKGSKSAYHTGIYLSDGLMIHSGGGSGDRTAIASIEKFAGEYSKVVYVKILGT